jgi:hypothetical protein
MPILFIYITFPTTFRINQDKIEITSGLDDCGLITTRDRGSSLCQLVQTNYEVHPASSAMFIIAFLRSWPDCEARMTTCLQLKLCYTASFLQCIQKVSVQLWFSLSKLKLPWSNFLKHVNSSISRCGHVVNDGHFQHYYSNTHFTQTLCTVLHTVTSWMPCGWCNCEVNLRHYG